MGRRLCESGVWGKGQDGVTGQGGKGQDCVRPGKERGAGGWGAGPLVVGGRYFFRIIKTIQPTALSILAQQGRSTVFVSSQPANDRLYVCASTYLLCLWMTV